MSSCICHISALFCLLCPFITCLTLTLDPKICVFFIIYLTKLMHLFLAPDLFCAEAPEVPEDYIFYLVEIRCYLVGTNYYLVHTGDVSKGSYL